ncbi:MAG: heme lyase CcmF/NrfE family subunit [Gammaproteobacteria bacterium]|nr:heme lyase CcmF/NrfE family subunit [Gammaproteobacteria bacterium]
MIPELGQFALVLALGLSLIQASVPLAGATIGRQDWMALARPMAAGQFVFVALAFAVLAHSSMTDDFSVRYVAINSNSALPLIYKLAAVWGGHEGSLLLWLLILATWTLAVAFASRSLPEVFAARVIGVLGIVSVGVLAFTILTSNPFDRLLPAAADGNDLNPLLQDPALVIHPPMLYVGYVGLAVPFAFAIAALLTGSLDKNWARWTRPWTISAWVFLTIGISLGSWWAYYELGWGGWWFWDPVENASFMPWLAGTALIHSLAVTERRGIFKSWTVLLAIAAFSLSLLGTFLVRSGVLISVHAFAADPARGLFILLLLSVISGGALLLYGVRAGQMEAEGGFRLVSREAFLLLNNILLLVATAAVLFGTLYPLFLDALGLGKISVGPPYFNSVFLVPMLPMLVLLGAGMHASWLSQKGETLARKLAPAAVIAIISAITVPLVVYGGGSVFTVIGLAVGFWVVLTALWDPITRALPRKTRPLPLSRAQWGMSVAHLGVGVFVLGVTVTSSFGIESDQSMRPGDTLDVAGYSFAFRDVRQVEGINYEAVEAEVEVRRDGQLVTILTPQKRVYRVQQSPMTEAAIDPALNRDLFIALGEPLGGGAWSVRVQYKPFIRFIWLGTLIMAFGGLLAATDRRYRAVPQTSRAVSSPQPATESV